MLEMILYALGLPDSSFYQKPDIYDKIYEQVTEIDERYGSAVIGPSEFNAAKETKYPFFCIWKTNTLRFFHGYPLKIQMCLDK